MSRILKNKKKICLLVACLFIDVALAASLNRWLWLIIIFNIVVISLFIANKKVIVNLDDQKTPFGFKSKIRNVDCLIIGDMCDVNTVLPDDCKSLIQIKAPYRSLKSSFEILKHTSSIVKEYGGTIVIVVRKASEKNTKISVFDVPFLADITLKKYHILNLKKKARFPMLISPIRSLILLLNKSVHGFHRIQCPCDNLIQFCNERDYKLYYMEK